MGFQFIGTDYLHFQMRVCIDAVVTHILGRVVVQSQLTATVKSVAAGGLGRCGTGAAGCQILTAVERNSPDIDPVRQINIVIIGQTCNLQRSGRSSIRAGAGHLIEMVSHIKVGSGIAVDANGTIGAVTCCIFGADTKFAAVDLHSVSTDTIQSSFNSNETGLDIDFFIDIQTMRSRRDRCKGSAVMSQTAIANVNSGINTFHINVTIIIAQLVVDIQSRIIGTLTCQLGRAAQCAEITVTVNGVAGTGGRNQIGIQG